MRSVEAEEGTIIEYGSPKRAKTKRERSLDEILASLNDESENAHVSVYRQAGTGKETLQLVMKCAPDEYSTIDDLLLHLRDTYGGGDYRVHVRQNGLLKANSLISVAEPLKRAAEATATGTDRAIEGILQRMDKQDQRMEMLMERLVSGSNSVPSEDAMIDRMLKYKQLFDSGPKADLGGVTAIREAVTLAKELGAEFGSAHKDEEDSGFGDLINQFAPILAKAQSQPQPKPQPQYAEPPMIEQMIASYVARNFTSGMSPYAMAEDALTYPPLVDKVLTDKAGCLAVLQANSQTLKKPAAVLWLEDVCQHLYAMHGMPSKFADAYSESEIVDNEEPADNSAEGASGD